MLVDYSESARCYPEQSGLTFGDAASLSVTRSAKDALPGVTIREKRSLLWRFPTNNANNCLPVLAGATADTEAIAW